jgi:hypothetical protein
MGLLEIMNKLVYVVVFGCLALAQVCAEEANQVSQYGITWTFDKAYPVGQFCTGDYWVRGPVRVVGITTDLHAPGFTPKPGQDGSMVNPGTDSKQGYDNRLSSYDAARNASLGGGKPISADNPLDLNVNSSLVSMVSWLYRSEKEAEPGAPQFNGMTKAPRPVTRSAAVLTVLPSAPQKGSFRPSYAGNDKSVKFNSGNLDVSKLKNLPPVADTPDPETVTKRLERPWIDHVHEFLGAMVHPSENMPNYGREMGITVSQAALLLHLDFARLPGHLAKDKLLFSLVQLGIDNTGIADNGGGWPNNGGHHLGRKWPILFAGVMLNDPHMKDVGHWKTRFQEDEQTFYVTQAEVDITHSPKWNPDKRGGALEPYTAEDIGMPEWGIRHASQPEADNRAMSAPYRSVNSPVYPGFVLAARIMGLEEAWNHKALFDYTDRWMNKTGGRLPGSVNTSPFVINLWKAHRSPKTE